MAEAFNLQRNRGLRSTARAIANPRQYIAAYQAVRQFPHPADFFRRYGNKGGAYPAEIAIRTPVGDIAPTLFSWHDAKTIHEIFLAGDYQIDNDRKVIVDFGSNIGISAAYFLTRNSDNFIYLFEPVPHNLERLRYNMRPFAGRYVLNERAVGLKNGIVRFGIEDTGRYGGVGLNTGREILVDCVNSNEVLEEIVRSRGHIDVLKIDVETMEQAIVAHLPLELARHITLLLVESRFAVNPLAETHRMTMQGTISRFELKAGRA